MIIISIIILIVIIPRSFIYYKPVYYNL